MVLKRRLTCLRKKLINRMKSFDSSVFSIFRIAEFCKFRRTKIFKGNEMDSISGFVHLSTKDQVVPTLNNYFSNEKNVIIAEFKITSLKNYLKWEISTDSKIFPHYYGILKFYWVRALFRETYR